MRLLLLTALLLLVAHTQAAAYCNFPNETPEETRACLFLNEPIPGLFEGGRASILTILGEPVSVDEKERANPYTEGQTDVYTHFKFPGVDLWVLFLAGDPTRPFPHAMEVRDPKVTMRFGIRVGSSADHVKAQLGSSEGTAVERWEYTGIAGGRIVIEFENSRVTAVYWSPYQG